MLSAGSAFVVLLINALPNVRGASAPSSRALLFGSAVVSPTGPDDGQWWEDFKQAASDAELYQAVFELPKGGDTHCHLSGSLYPEEVLDLAVRAEDADGIVFWVRVESDDNCEGAGPLLGLRFEATVKTYSPECQAQYIKVKDMTAEQTAAWTDITSLHYTESRVNFFGNDINYSLPDPAFAAAQPPSGKYLQPWDAYGDVWSSSWVWLESLAIFLHRSAGHNLQYVENDFDPRFTVRGADLTPVPASEFKQMVVERLAKPDIEALGIAARFQLLALRFLPSSESDLEAAMRFVAEDCNDHWVGVDIVGYESQDFPVDGSTRRFRKTSDRVLRTSHCVGIGFHSGEKTKEETELELRYGAGSVLSITVDEPGSGYIDPPLVTIRNSWASRGSFAPATAAAEISDGKVTAITVTFGGSEYLPSYTAVEIEPPPRGTPATATANVAPGMRNVLDAILLGSTRVGHATNAHLDDTLMLSLMGGHVLLEQQLVGSLALKYVQNYEEHPFPFYLRKNVPISLSTDDMGIYESTITDDWFVAVKEFNLSWEEVKQIGRASIGHSFLKPYEKAELLAKLDQKQQEFAEKMRTSGKAALGDGAASTVRAFPCWWYGETLGKTEACEIAKARVSNVLPI